MELFTEISIETIGACNRKCPTCIRNSSKEPEISSWFSGKKLSFKLIKKIIFELKNMGYGGNICLQHYNEPLLDKRFPYILKFIKDVLPNIKIFINTNGDYLNSELAEKIDGLIDEIYISDYNNESNTKEGLLKFSTLFKKTKIIHHFVSHTTTHFSPKSDLDIKIAIYKYRICTATKYKLIINHLGEMLLCCEDIPPHFNLGNIKDLSLHDLWFNKKHEELIKSLLIPENRMKYAYCAICPRR
jgi:radical SAM protein with 4Fe4S-binding SPASM domain